MPYTFAGGTVNRSMLLVAANGIVMNKSLMQLREHGRPIKIGIKWEESFLDCHSYIKCKSVKYQIPL